jgi:hypothetical protein
MSPVRWPCCAVFSFEDVGRRLGSLLHHPRLAQVFDNSSSSTFGFSRSGVSQRSVNRS